jgi:phage tail sheath protein FI
MATLRGFPASNTISPSVRITENDFTFVSPTTSFHKVGLIGFASKGPINTPTSVRTLTDLVTKFGNPHPDTSDPYLIYAAQQVLRVSSEVVITRVADTDPTSNTQANSASVLVPSTGGLVDIIGSSTGTPSITPVASGTFEFVEDGYFSWKLNNILASKILIVPKNDPTTNPDYPTDYTLEELVDYLNSQLNPSIDGIQFVATTSETLGVKSTWAYGVGASIELVSHQNSIYGGINSIVGLGTSMTQAELTGSTNRYPPSGSAGSWDFDTLDPTDLANALQVVVTGTGNVNIDDVVQIIDLSVLNNGPYTTAEVVDEINTQIDSLTGGFVASDDGSDHIVLTTLAYGSGSKILVKSESSMDSIFGISNITATGDSPVKATGSGLTAQAGKVTGGANGSGSKSFTIFADSPGIEGNQTRVIITTNPYDGTFQMQVYNNGQQVESWGNLTKNQLSSFYVESYLNTVSNFIRVSDNTAVTAPPANTSTTGLLLTGGTDGIPVDPDTQDDLIIGNPTAGTGLYSFSEPEQVDIDLIATPGRSSTAVVRVLIDICESYRQDALAIIDPPFGLTVNEIVNWQNGVHPLNNTRLDTDFAALYYPWVDITDTFNNISVWVPPSGSVLAAICQSDSISGPWYAPAGLTRGVVPNINNVFSRPSLAERDLMYGNNNAINPIISYPDVGGFVIWGQKTLQRAPTALDRINVRRMLFYVEKSIKSISKNYLFEPNNAATRSAFINACSQILTRLVANSGAQDFVVKCDDELNTSDVIARNELRARIGIVPVYAIEFIFIEFNLVRTLA